MSESAGQSVFDAVDSINEDVFLPGIQRDLVWEEKKIKKLFDSVIEDYPFGEIVYWDIDDISENQIIYKFIQHKVESYPIENDLKDDVNTRFYVDKDELQYRNQQVDDNLMKELANSDKTRRFVIDGQQRLSAFFIGLRGSYSSKKDGEWRAAKQLYIEVTDSRSNDFATNDLRNNLRFKDEGGENVVVTGSSVWLRLGMIYDFQSKYDGDCVDKLFSAIRENLEESDRGEVMGEVIQTVNKLWQKLVNDESKVNTYTLDDREPDDIIEAFVRINTSGEKLKKSDLFLSILTNSWADAGLNAKEEINQFVECVKDEGFSEGFSFNVKKTLDALSMCLDGMATGYQISDFSKDGRIAEAKEKWVYDESEETIKDGQVQSAIFKSLDFLTERGFDSKAMTKQSHALMPLIYYFFKNPDVELGWDSPTDANGNAIGDKLEYFVSIALLDSVYSRRFEQIDKHIKKGIDASEPGDFSLQAIKEEIDGSTNFNLKPRPLEVKNALHGSVFSNGGAYGILRLMYYPFREPHTEYERDHVLCKSRFNEAELRDNDFSEVEAATLIDDWKHSPANIELLPNSLHDKKEERTPKSWFNKIEEKNHDYLEGHYPNSDVPEDYFETHMIPQNSTENYKVKNIKSFFEERSELISEYLQDKYDDEFLESR